MEGPRGAAPMCEAGSKMVHNSPSLASSSRGNLGYFREKDHRGGECHTVASGRSLMVGRVFLAFGEPDRYNRALRRRA
jgi:hypothetical protein